MLPQAYFVLGEQQKVKEPGFNNVPGTTHRVLGNAPQSSQTLAAPALKQKWLAVNSGPSLKCR